MIPKVFSFIWVGSPLPGWARANIDEWRRLNPGWGCIIWDETLMPRLMNQHLYDRAEEIVAPDAVGQFRSDIARYEILYKHGGFYADVDTWPLRPIDDAVLSHHEFAVREDEDYVGNTYLGSEIGSPIMLALIGNLTHNVNQHGRGARATMLSGPQYLTSIWNKLGGHVDDRTDLWFPHTYQDVKKGRENEILVSADAYAIHHFNHVRELKGRGLRDPA